MKTANLILVLMVSMATFLASCKVAPKGDVKSEAKSIDSQETQPLASVMTKEDQAALTPQMVLQDFKDGNARFHSGTITKRNHTEQIRKAAPGQFPKAVVLSCLDSRVPVEDVFDQGLGDVFVGRVAGNFINVDLLGSMEFACKVAGAKLVMVMGHQDCGAIKGAIDDVKLGNITEMLAKIKPAVAKSQDFTGDKKSSNPAFVKHVCINNVSMALTQIRAQSSILKEMEDKGEIKIVGVFYRLTDGTLEFVQ